MDVDHRVPVQHGRPIASMCTQTLRQICDLLWADEIVRLSMSGCRSLERKLASSVHSFHHRIDPWFSQKSPTTTSAFPLVQTISTEASKAHYFSYTFAVPLPPSITSLSLNSPNTLGLIHDLLKADASALPLLSTLNFGYDSILSEAIPEKSEQSTFIVHNMLGRRILQRLSVPTMMISHKAVGEVRICLETQLPFLRYLKIPFRLTFVPHDHNGSVPGQPPQLETLIHTGQHTGTMAQFFASLPRCLLRLTTRNSQTAVLSRQESAALPRGLTYFELYSLCHLPPDDSGGFLSSLPQHLSTLAINNQRSFKMCHYNALPASVKRSIICCKVQDVDMSTREYDYIIRGVRRGSLRNTKIHGGGSYVDCCGQMIYTSAFSVYSEDGSPLPDDCAQPEIERLDLTVFEASKTEPSDPPILLNLPPNLRELVIHKSSSQVFRQGIDHSPTVDASSWPSTLSTIHLAIALPASLNLHTLSNLTSLKFTLPVLTRSTHTLLPPTLRTLEIKFLEKSPSHMATLLCSLPPLLFDLQLRGPEETSLSNIPIIEIGPEIAGKLPRGLVTLRLPTCTMLQACLPFLPTPLKSLFACRGPLTEWIPDHYRW